MVPLLKHREASPRLVVLAAVVLFATVIVGVRAGEPARATSGGDPYSVPQVVDTNPDPNVVETTIVARNAMVDIGNGVKANAETFNGSIPGPEFRLKVGDTVIVHFTNLLPAPEVTGIHWHGIELDNESDGTPVTQNQVPSGGSFLYKFVVPRPGVFWYHPHHHSSTNQVFKGLYGGIVVSDPHDPALVAKGVLPPPAQTRSIVLSDTTVCKTPGSNDTQTYNPNLPWVGGGPLPVQPPPVPKTLCEANTPSNPAGGALDLDGNPRKTSFQKGDIPNIQSLLNGTTNEGQTVLTNGKNVGGRGGTPEAPGSLAPGASVLNVSPGQGLRLQIANVATTRYMRLRLTDGAGKQIPLVRVGGEGGLLDNALVEGGPTGAGFNTQIGVGEILLAAADRADVVAAIPPTATGVATLWTEDFQRTGGPCVGQGCPVLPKSWAYLPTVPVMHLRVAGRAGNYTIADGTPILKAVGASVPVLGPPTDTLLDPATFTPPKTGFTGPNIDDISFTNKNAANKAQLGFDTVSGTGLETLDYTTTPHIGSTRFAKLGDTLELTVTNTTGAHHPFHLHGFSMQPLSFTPTASSPPGSPSYVFGYHEFLDNIDVPATYDYTFRVKLEDRNLIDGTTPGGAIGRWVFHCHIFFHHTLGMISELVVVNDASGNERPDVNSDTTATTVPAGGDASMTGTFSDIDGDPVTLASSIGSVTPTGAKTWSWTAPTLPGPIPSQIVYVTATDSHGNKSQTAFNLFVGRIVVSGTGTIASPPGAYAADPSLAGPAQFSFNATNDRGSGTTSVGATTFGFRAPKFSLVGVNQEFVAIAGAGGQLVGTARVNGADGYSFLLTFVDGQLPGGGGTDKFRIKVWNTATNAVVYDNVPGAPDGANPPPISSGTIVVNARP